MRKLNNKKIAPFLVILSLFLVASIVAYLTMEKPEVQPGVGGGPGTINQLEQWKSDGTNITQSVANKPIKITGLSTGDCLTLNGSSVLTTTTCGAGGSSTTTINGVSGPAFTFASGTATGIGLTISTSTGTITFTPTVSSGYVIPLTASTTEWHNKVSSQWGTSGSNIYYSAGNVGIGTTTPTERLAVTGEGSGVVLMGETGFGSGYSGLSFNGELGVTTYNLLGGVTQNHLWINRKTGGDIYFRENNVDQVVIKGTTGNVGIGTTSPAYKLDVNGTSVFRNIARFGSAADSGWLTWDQTTANTFNVGAQSGKALSLGSNGVADRIFINTSGNVGIGTTNQTSYDVAANNLVVYEAGDGGITVAGGTTNKGSLTFADGISGSAYRGGIQYNHSTDKLQLWSNGLITSTPEVTLSNGNVGIGSSTPSSKLTVQGNTWIGGNVTATGTLAVTGSTTISSLATANCDVFATALGSLYCGTNGAGGGTVTSVDMSVPTGLSISGNPITTSGTLALTLTSGYVIPLSASTTEWTNFYNTPSTRITDGTGLTWSGNTLNVDDVYVLNTGDSISGNLTFSGTTANIALGSNWLSGDGGDEGIYVDSSGNVGIGTTSPSEKLHVVTSGYLGGITLSGSNTIGTSLLLDSTATGGRDYALFSTANGSSAGGGLFSIYDQTATQHRLVVNSTGNVGIGTTTPAARLQVTGVAGTNPFRVASSSNTSLFEITQLGRVGIGSSSPSHTLTVAGDMNVTGAARISIPRSFTWPGVATTTSATSTVPLGIAMSAEAWNSARCKTTSGTAAWLFKDDAGNRMNGGTASTTSTSTLVTLSTNNTFTTGEGRNVDIGPLTNAIITCSIDVTINN